jgi:phosphatidylserine/phosphatidylglycerophosphate/cardiolipin synthase-like enzyme
MSAVFVPVLRFGVAYPVLAGRRWSILEQMLLVELCGESRSLGDLAVLANLPSRMIVEALIALLRSNWVEVRADQNGIKFVATGAGRRRAAEKELPVFASREVRLTSLCFERLTGSWLRSDDLTLVYKDDLPDNALLLPIRFQTYDPNDGSFRELLTLSAEETLAPEAPKLKQPSYPYARFDVFNGEVVGLPAYVSLDLADQIEQLSPKPSGSSAVAHSDDRQGPVHTFRDTIALDDIVVGGPSHLELLCRVLASARSTVVLHSCFVHPGVVERILPDLTAAAKRGVRVELLWGLRTDAEAEAEQKPPPIVESEAVLRLMPEALRRKVQLSPYSTGSHAKVLLWDRTDGRWNTVVGSCNWLSSWFEAVEVSVATRSPGIASAVLGWLVGMQLPAAGGWPPVARRLNKYWNDAKLLASEAEEIGKHSVRLVLDDEHLACVRRARDRAKRDIVLGCDLYGLAAETTALVPLQRAAELGQEVSMFYRRPSRRLVEEGYRPEPSELKRRGLGLQKAENLHGKFLVWDDEHLAATSFNWFATVPDTRARGAEIGLLLDGPALRDMTAAAFRGAGADIIAEALGARDTTSSANITSLASHAV